MKRLLEDRQGAAYVEFLLAFVPLFIMFLGMVQMALMYAADLVVQHSATTAARAAAVVIDDDPQYYEGAERGDVSSFGVTSSEDVLGSVVSIFGGDLSGIGGVGSSPGGPRMAAIRRAASIPLMAVSPSMDQLMDSDSVRTAIGSPEMRGATGLLVYNNSAMGVTFPESPGATNYTDSWDNGDMVVTRVTYLFHCGVPVVSRMMCSTYPELRLGPAVGVVTGILSDLRDGSLGYDEAMARLRHADTLRRRHERDSPALDELETAGSDDLMWLTGFTGARFKILRAEAAMPLQAANYEY